MLKKSQRRLCVSLLIGFVGATTSKAIQPSDILLYEVGPFSIRPQFNFDLQYNDNIFYRETNVEDDLITVISPAIKFQVGQQLPDENRASVQYTLNQLFFLENSQLDTTQHRITTDLRYNSSRFLITGRDNIDFLDNVIGGAFGIPGIPVSRVVVSDLYTFLYRIGAKTSAYLQADHTLTDFEETAPLFDRQRLEGTLGFDWNYSERTKFFGELFYGQIFVDPNLAVVDPPDADFIGGFLGIRGNFTDRLSARLKAGLESTTFDDGTDAGAAPVADLSLSFAATERLTFDLSYARRQEVSVQFSRSAFTSDRVALQASHVLGSTGRLRLAAQVAQNWLTYEPSAAYRDRDDTYTSADVHLTYYFETWFIARLGYAFEMFESSLPRTQAVDYKVNRVTLGIAVGF